MNLFFVFQGPILYKWYGLLETKIVFQNKYVGILGRVAADQLVFAPTFLYMFFWITGTLQGLSAATIKGNIAGNYPDVLIANYKVQQGTLTFYCLPLH